jgi:hypothetical protein
MVHETVRSSAVNPASLREKLNFMAKHPACAAAMSSSGFVPTPSANLELKEYCVLFKTVLAEVNVPLPSLPVPFQLAVDVRFITLTD